MSLFEAAGPMHEAAPAERRDSVPFVVLENPLFQEPSSMTADLCLYIEDMARELRGAAMAANQELLAFLLGAAAAEARLQAGKLCLDQMRR